jgi:hypothetical protein
MSMCTILACIVLIVSYLRGKLNRLGSIFRWFHVRYGPCHINKFHALLRSLLTINDKFGNILKKIKFCDFLILKKNRFCDFFNL